MPEKKDQYKPLTREDLDKLAGEALPERAAMSLINANVAAPVNAALGVERAERLAPSRTRTPSRSPTSTRPTSKQPGSRGRRYAPPPGPMGADR